MDTQIIESLVCSKDLSIRLRKCGVNQESLFCWYEHQIYLKNNIDNIDQDGFMRPLERIGRDGFYRKVELSECYAAFTSAELGNILPKIVFIGEKQLNLAYGYMLNKKNLRSVYTASYTDFREYEIDTNEANLRAKLFLYAVDKKLIIINQNH